MKSQVTLVILFFALAATAQDYSYINFNFDPNKATGLVDNPRTETDVRGLDWEIEAGVRYHQWGIYMFYGAFQERDYQSYGAGADYFFNWLRDTKAYIYNPFSGHRGQILTGIDLSAGAYLSVILRQDGNKNWGGSLPVLSIRGQVIFWLGNNWGGVLKAKGQGRPDIDKRLIFEADVGLIIVLGNYE